MTKFSLELSYDDQPDCPMDWDLSWKLISFRRNSIHSDDPAEYCHVKDGEVRPNFEYLSKFRAGLAFFLDYYEHGQGAYSIHGEGMQCQWDTAQYGGILLWEHSPKEMGAKSYEDREKDARGFLETYNAWMNGEVYGYTLKDEEGNLVDSCWGYYDDDYFMQEICQHFKEGDTVTVSGDASYVFDDSKLPKGVEVEHAKV